MFLESHSETTCTYEQYRTVFATNFNLGFGRPKTDVCAVCEGKKNLIEATTDEDRKKEIITELINHTQEAEKFYQLLNKKQEDGVLTVCFDLMQNQVLPKTPIGDAYYSRQIYQYFLGVVRHQEEDLSKDDVHVHVCFYTWGEYQSARGEN